MSRDYVEGGESIFMYHMPCENCGSSDGNSMWSDGHQWCYVCETWLPPDGESKGGTHRHSMNNTKSSNSEVPLLRMSECNGYYSSLPARGIDKETCQKYGYWVGTVGGVTYQIADYRNELGELILQKTRDKNKDFKLKGNTREEALFGQHLWNGGKKLVVTEGEIDCLTVAQVQSCKYPVVSIPKGAKAAKKTCAKLYEYFDQFSEIILMFDMDEAGRAAVKEAAEVLPQGKVKVATLPYKDANECYLAGDIKAITDAIWNAAPFVPDGVVSARSLKERVFAKAEVESLPFPISQSLNDRTLGAREGELIMLTSGTGMGKSTYARIASYIWGHLQHIPIGLCMLEEAVEESCLDLMGLHVKKRIRQYPKSITDDEREAAWTDVFENDNFYLYDSFAESQEDRLLAKLGYMVHGLGRKVIILDHISIVVSGMDEGGDERKTIDRLVTKLKSFAKTSGCIIIAITHLKRLGWDSQSHEEGGKVSLSHLRGSGSIAQLSDTVIAFERDQQGEDPNVVTPRVLKCRFTGDTGVCDPMVFSRETGWLTDCISPPEHEEHIENKHQDGQEDSDYKGVQF